MMGRYVVGGGSVGAKCTQDMLMIPQNKETYIRAII